MNIPLICGITAGIAAVAAASVILVGKQRKNKKDDTSVDTKITIITKGIHKDAAVYEGLYESLHTAVEPQSEVDAEAYTEWCGRVERSEDSAYKEAFADVFSDADAKNNLLLQKKIRLLLKCIDAAGIVRAADTGDTLVCTESDVKKYVSAEGAMVPEHEYLIVKPAWLCGDKVIEPGLAMPK